MHNSEINKKRKELFMGTLNGKLINQELSNFDELTQKTERINQRFEHLESQVTAISKQDYTQYFQKISEEVNSNKSYLQKMEQKIGFLEDVTSRQAKQLFFLKISTVIGLIALWFIFGINNQPEDRKIQHQKQVKSLEFIQPESRNGLFLDI
jgi:small-conductance mechanosensitive channel